MSGERCSIPPCSQELKRPKGRALGLRDQVACRSWCCSTSMCQILELQQEAEVAAAAAEEKPVVAAWDAAAAAAWDAASCEAQDVGFTLE